MTLRSEGQEAEKIAWLVTWFPSKHEAPEFDFQNPYKKLGIGAPACKSCGDRSTILGLGGLPALTTW